MADKKNLDDMLAQGTARPMIRRGQGIRLSTDASPDERSREDSSSAPAQERTQVHEQASRHAQKTESAQERKLENAQPGKRTSAQHAGDAPERVTRVSQGQRLRVDLVKQLKRIAVEEDRKLYEVMEEAIEQYIERRKHDMT